MSPMLSIFRAHMADYAVEGGRFLAACDELLTANFTLSWYDRFPSADHVIAGQASMANHIQGRICWRA